MDGLSRSLINRLNDRFALKATEMLHCREMALRARNDILHGKSGGFQEKFGYTARSTRVSFSLRSATKSIGLVRRVSAPPSNALRLVSSSP